MKRTGETELLHIIDSSNTKTFNKHNLLTIQILIVNNGSNIIHGFYFGHVLPDLFSTFVPITQTSEKLLLTLDTDKSGPSDTVQ
jgi:hypothetical protein